MEVSIHEVFERFRESGIVESPASEAVIKRALIEVYGEAFSTEKVFNYLMENGAWTLEAQARIHSILQNFEGQMVVHSEQQLAHARLVHAILNDTERWGLTEEQKMSIVKDRPLIQRWSNEFSEAAGPEGIPRPSAADAAGHGRRKRRGHGSGRERNADRYRTIPAGTDGRILYSCFYHRTQRRVPFLCAGDPL